MSTPFRQPGTGRGLFGSPIRRTGLGDGTASNRETVHRRIALSVLAKIFVPHRSSRPMSAWVPASAGMTGWGWVAGVQVFPIFRSILERFRLAWKHNRKRSRIFPAQIKQGRYLNPGTRRWIKPRASPFETRCALLRVRGWNGI